LTSPEGNTRQNNPLISEYDAAVGAAAKTKFALKYFCRYVEAVMCAEAPAERARMQLASGKDMRGDHDGQWKEPETIFAAIANDPNFNPPTRYPNDPQSDMHVDMTYDGANFSVEVYKKAFNELLGTFTRICANYLKSGSGGDLGDKSFDHSSEFLKFVSAGSCKAGVHPLRVRYMYECFGGSYSSLRASNMYELCSRVCAPGEECDIFRYTLQSEDEDFGEAAASSADRRKAAARKKTKKAKITTERISPEMMEAEATKYDAFTRRLTSLSELDTKNLIGKHNRAHKRMLSEMYEEYMSDDSNDDEVQAYTSVHPPSV